MNRPWMPLYVGDYVGDTGHLTTVQHGAYLLLMMHYWRKGELPDDDRQLRKIAKLPLKTWCQYRATLQDFFYEGWKHKRIDAELAKMMRVSEKRAIAGQKGGIEQRSGLSMLPGCKALRDGYIVQASPVIQELSPHLGRQAGMGKLGGQTGYKSVSQQQGEQGHSYQPGEPGKCIVHRRSDAGLILRNRRHDSKGERRNAKRHAAAQDKDREKH